MVRTDTGMEKAVTLNTALPSPIKELDVLGQCKDMCHAVCILGSNHNIEIGSATGLSSYTVSSEGVKFLLGVEVIGILEEYATKNGYEHYTVEPFPSTGAFMYRCYLAILWKMNSEFPPISDGMLKISPFNYGSYIQYRQAESWLR